MQEVTGSTPVAPTKSNLPSSASWDHGLMTQRSRVIDYSGALFALIGAIISAILVAKHSFPNLIESSVGCDIGGID